MITGITTPSGMLSDLFLDTEKVFGSRDSCFLAMDSMKESICSFRGTTEELHAEMTGLVRVVTDMSPRIALLMMMMFGVLELYSTKRNGMSLEEEKALLCACIEDVKVKRRKSVEKLLHYSDGCIQSGDCILLHDISHTVFDILRRTQERGIVFTVCVAAQELQQTETLVSFLQQLSIPFTVVPEYLLIHVLDTVHKAFLGAVTINSQHEVIADAGSEAIVSQMHYHNIPVYVPVTTDKLSLWKAEHSHHAAKTTTCHSLGGGTYNKLIFSHDRYPIEQVTTFITNKGLKTPAEMKELYEEYFHEQEVWRKKMGL